MKEGNNSSVAMPFDGLATSVEILRYRPRPKIIGPPAETSATSATIDQ
jgi:hypothetical protein